MRRNSIVQPFKEDDEKKEKDKKEKDKKDQPVEYDALMPSPSGAEQSPNSPAAANGQNSEDDDNNDSGSEKEHDKNVTAPPPNETHEQRKRRKKHNKKERLKAERAKRTAAADAFVYGEGAAKQREVLEYEDLAIHYDISHTFCSVHPKSRLIRNVDQVHEYSKPFTCVHQKDLFYKFCENKMGRCNQKDFYVCPEPNCCMCVCAACIQLKFGARVLSRISRTMFIVRRVGALSYFGLVMLTLAQLLFLPSVRDSLRLFSCHVAFQCYFPECHIGPKDHLFWGAVTCASVGLCCLACSLILVPFVGLMQRKRMVARSSNELVIIAAIERDKAAQKKKRRGMHDPPPAVEKNAQDSSVKLSDVQVIDMTEQEAPPPPPGKDGETAIAVAEAGDKQQEGEADERQRRDSQALIVAAPAGTEVPFDHEAGLCTIMMMDMDKSDWEIFLENDFTVLRSLYDQFRLQFMWSQPVLYILQTLYVSAAVLPPNQFLQLFCIGALEMVTLIWNWKTDAFLDPWLGFIAEAGCVFQMSIAATVASYYVATQGDPVRDAATKVAYMGSQKENDDFYGNSMLGLTLLYFLALLATFVIVVVVPIIQKIKEARDEAMALQEDEEKEEAMRAHAAEARTKAEQVRKNSIAQPEQ